MIAPRKRFDGLRRTVDLSARKWPARFEATHALLQDCSQAELAARRQSA